MRNNVDERLLMAANEVPPESLGLTEQMRDAIQKKTIGQKFGAQLAAWRKLDEAVALMASAWRMSLHQVRREIGFTENEDAKFNDWMSAATAKIGERKNPRRKSLPLMPR